MIRFIFLLLFIFSIHSSYGQEDEWELKLENSYKAIEGNYSFSGFDNAIHLELKDKKFYVEESHSSCLEGGEILSYSGTYKINHGGIYFFLNEKVKLVKYDSEFIADENNRVRDSISSSDTLRLDYLSHKIHPFLEKHYNIYNFKNRLYFLDSAKDEFKDALIAMAQNAEIDSVDFIWEFLSKKNDNPSVELIFPSSHKLYRKENITVSYSEIFSYKDSIDCVKEFQIEHFQTLDSLSFRLIKENLPKTKDITIYKLNKGTDSGLDVGHILSNECMVLKIKEIFKNSALAEPIIGDKECENKNIALKYLNFEFAISALDDGIREKFDFENQKKP